MKKFLALLAFAAVLAFPGAAAAQSGCKYIVNGATLTAAQWNYCFQQKNDVLGYTPVNRAGDTMQGKLTTIVPSTVAGFNLQPGTLPATLVNGDLWTTSAGLYARINGATVGPFVDTTTGAVASFSAGSTGLTPSTATTGAVTLAGTLNVGHGGTGITTGTSGGLPYFSSTSTIASSAALAANQIVLGGGAGTTPASLGSLGTTTTLLHGNATGAPTFGAVALGTDVSGTLLATNFPALTGDVTTTAGSLATTLATVNSNVGSFGSSTSIPTFTVNAKGLITAASGNVVIAPAGTVTGTTLASNVVTSSLTTVGTIGSGTWQGTLVGPTYGGTGINNGTKTITLGGNLTTTGAGAATFALGASTQTYTFPTTTATLARTDAGQTFTGTQAFGAITYSTLNGNTWAAGTGTLAIGAGKTLTATNTLNFLGTDGSSVAFGTGGTVAYTASSVASITGTANQITASASTGAVTLSLPSTLIAPGTFAATTSGAFGGCTIGTDVLCGTGTATISGATSVGSLTTSALAIGTSAATLPATTYVMTPTITAQTVAISSLMNLSPVVTFSSAASYNAITAGGTQTGGNNSSVINANASAVDFSGAVRGFQTNYTVANVAVARSTSEVNAMLAQVSMGSTNTQSWSGTGSSGFSGIRANPRTTASATGTIAQASSFTADMNLSATGVTVTNGYGLYTLNPVNSGTLTNYASVGIVTPTSGTNNTGLLIGTGTTGNWAIYDASGYASRLSGALTVVGAVTAPTVAVTSGTPVGEGLFLAGVQTLGLSSNGTSQFTVSSNGLYSSNASGGAIKQSAATSTAPTLIPNRADTTTGIGAQASGNMSLIVGGAEVGRWTSTGLNNTNIGATTVGTGAFSTLSATGHTTFEGVTSTGATGAGKLVYDNGAALTGTPTAPTATFGTNTTQLATTAFVQAAIPVTGGARCFFNTTKNSGGGFTSASVLMMGFGGSYTCTPVNSGKFLVTFTCDGNFVAATVTRSAQGRYGTGGAPAYLAAATGTALAAVTSDTGAGTNIPQSVTLSYYVSGLTPSTPYWFDVGVSGSSTLDFACQAWSAVEL